MMGLGLGLGRRVLSAGGAPVTYERTAFLASTGNDGTGALNNPALPYLTLEACLAALQTAHPGESLIVRALDHVGDGSTTTTDAPTVDLTIRSHDGSSATLNFILYCGNRLVDLTLDAVTLAGVIWAESISLGTEQAGTITGLNDAVITSLAANGADGAAGAAGGDASSDTGAHGGNGANGDPPTAGESGESAAAEGDPGAPGAAGSAARDIVLDGSLTVASLSLLGGDGGAGGNGGDGEIATAGNGGNGGSSTSEGEQAGAGGGDGGDANANGGAGGSGGAGAAGGNVTLLNGAIVTAASLDGGTGGAGGIGGAAGSATPGSGGSGGSGANGGADGAPGNNGSAFTDPGVNGNPGADGADGSI